MNIPPGDAGGELDPHGATGNGASGPLRISSLRSTSVAGNPIGGLIFSGVFNNGQLEQLHEWTVCASYPSRLMITHLPC